MQRISFFCSACKKSLHVAYTFTGLPARPVMDGVSISCVHCKRVSTLHWYTERKLVEAAHGDKVYI